MQFNRADRLSIHDNDIAERGSGCYGIKMVSKKGSPAIHAGVVLPGVTEKSADAPDLGAFEFGKPAWRAGIVKAGKQAAPTPAGKKSARK